MPTVSVAMAVCNGVAYLCEQLQSIVAQTRPVDEVVICDDASTDASATLVAEFASKLPVRCLTQPSRQGVQRTFACAIAACTGTFVVLADQDDRWHPDRIARLMARATAADQPDAVFSDAALIGAEGQDLGARLWDRVGFHAADQQRFHAGTGLQVLLRRQVVTGATLLLRREHADWLLPVGEGWMHDGWFAALLAAAGRVDCVAEPLIGYRQHGGNLIGAPAADAAVEVRQGLALAGATYAAEAARWELVAARLQTRGGVPPAHLAAIQAKIAHARWRATLPAAHWRRLGPVLASLGRGEYHRFALGLRSAGRDVLAAGRPA